MAARTMTAVAMSAAVTSTAMLGEAVGGQHHRSDNSQNQIKLAKHLAFPPLRGARAKRKRKSVTAEKTRPESGPGFASLRSGETADALVSGRKCAGALSVEFFI